MSTLIRLVRLLGLPPWRVALSVGLGALAVVAGAVLVGLAGYLICRAAGRPPILSLTTIMVAVRAAALTRPGARYAERLTSHDLAFRALGNVRARVLARIEPLAPAALEAYRDGELLSRMVADVDRLQDVALRLLLPVGVAVVASTVVVGGVLVVFPAAGVLLGVGLAGAAVLGPVVAARVVARSQRRQAALRARLTADLVDALDAADELWLNGADGRAAAALAAVPLTPTPALPRRDRPIATVDFAALRRRPPVRPLLLEAEAQLAAAPPSREPAGFVHGDLWQGNALWAGETLTALVDWDCAGSGPAGVDLGSLRCDAAICFGTAAAADVLAGWEEAYGRPAAEVARWDVVAALSTPPDLGWFPGAIAGQGRPDLRREVLLARRDAFLGDALGRLDGGA